jgi:hypothetical protein
MAQAATGQVLALQTFTANSTTYQAGTVYTLPESTYGPLINQGLMQLQGVPFVNPQGSAGTSSAYTAIPASTYTLTAADSGLSYQLTNTSGVTITGPAAGVTLTAAVVFDCPATGTVTVTPSSGTTINGATASLTFTRAQFPTGFVLTPHPEGNSYGVTAASVVSSGTQILLKSTIPYMVASSCTIGANGAVTGLQGVTLTYPTGCWMYFGANAIGASVPAGFYWFTFSSVSAGTVFNNLAPSTLTTGGNAGPATPTAFSGTAGGAYTAVTGSNFTFGSITIPAGTMQINSIINFDLQGYQTVNQTNGYALVLNGAQQVAFAQMNSSTPLYLRAQNLGTLTNQLFNSFGGSLGNQNVPFLTTINTANAFSLNLCIQLTNANLTPAINSILVTLN